MSGELVQRECVPRTPNSTKASMPHEARVRTGSGIEPPDHDYDYARKPEPRMVPPWERTTPWLEEALGVKANKF